MDELKWTTALPDWERRIMAGESLVPVRPLYPDMANRAVQFFASLVLRDVLGQPRIGDVTRPWVYDFVGAIFGAQHPTTYRREINDFFLLISKKNSKSTIAAAIMLTAMDLDERESSEYLILAPTKEVADNSFKPAWDMIRSDPALKATYHIQPHTRTITNRVTRATLKVVAADDKTVGGSKATGVLIDELHLFGKVANAESIITEATGGLLSRIDGFVIKLSTQSTEPPAGVFRAELDLARDVRDGKVVNPNYLPVLYEFPRAMLDSKAYENPDNFHITNPNLGASVDVRTLLTLKQKAEAKGGEAIAEFYAKHLNVEIGLNLRNDRWVGADFWERQARPEMAGLPYLLANCDVVTAGIDGGGMDDLLGFVLLGRLKTDQESWLVWSRAWVNRVVLERRKQIAPLLLDFERQGDLQIVDEFGQEYEQMAALIAEVRDCGLLGGIGIDPARNSVILDALNRHGFADSDATGVKQGYQLTNDIKMAEQKLGEGRLFHGGQPLLAWSIANAKAELRGNAVYITKQAAGVAKIDPVIALFCAVNIMQDPKLGMDSPGIITL